jgi:phospholipase D-like protein
VCAPAVAEGWHVEPGSDAGTPAGHRHAPLPRPAAGRRIVGMTLLLIAVGFIALVLAVVTIVDLVRHEHSGWATAGWIVLILILPFIGSLAYWIARPATKDEVEQAYLAESDFRGSGALTSERRQDQF